MKPNERLIKLREQMQEFHKSLREESKLKEQKTSKNRKVVSNLNLNNDYRKDKTKESYGRKP